MPSLRPGFVDLASGFAIAAAPKVGTLSIVELLFELQFGRKPRAREATHNWAVATSLVRPLQDAVAAGIPIVAVHRDPFERLRSAYQHRVVKEREAPARSFWEFCEHLGNFRKYGGIAWHTDPQTKWLGHSSKIYAASLGLDELWRLPALLSHLTGRQFPEIGWKHRMARKPEWEPGLKDLLAPWVREDLDAGWNGVTPAEVLKIGNRTIDLSSIVTLQAASIPIDLDRYQSLADWGWHRKFVKEWQQHLASDAPTRVLEIGAFDGVSANRMLDLLFTHPESTVDAIDPYRPDPTTPKVSDATRGLFEENRRRGGHRERIRLHHGTSREVLAQMAVAGEDERYDVVYVDGGHTAPDVLSDAVMSWPLLRPGGVMVFDDFGWGEGRIPQLRPREAILAFEAAFAREIIPLHQGYQHMIRKVGVPGGLKTKTGAPFKGVVAIVGNYNSGSSLLSLMMETLGFDIGRPTWEDFGECSSFREILVAAFDEKAVRETIGRDEVTERLRKWINQVRPHGGSLCLKHPLVGMFLPEISEAFGPDVHYLRIQRPLEESIRKLALRQWFPEPDRLQRLLHHRTEAFFRNVKAAHSVDYQQLLTNPALHLQKLIENLDLDVTEVSINKAVQVVRKPKAVP